MTPFSKNAQFPILGPFCPNLGKINFPQKLASITFLHIYSSLTLYKKLEKANSAKRLVWQKLLFKRLTDT